MEGSAVPAWRTTGRQTVGGMASRRPRLASALRLMAWPGGDRRPFAPTLVPVADFWLWENKVKVVDKAVARAMRRHIRCRVRATSRSGFAFGMNRSTRAGIRAVRGAGKVWSPRTCPREQVAQKMPKGAPVGPVGRGCHLDRGQPNRKLEAVMPFMKPASLYTQVPASASAAPTATISGIRCSSRG